LSRGILNFLPPDLLSVIGSIDREEHALSAKLGVIEEDACADIILVDGISLKDITVLEASPKVLEGKPRIKKGFKAMPFIMKDGKIFKNML